jgi:hypothetical protein
MSKKTAQRKPEKQKFKRETINSYPRSWQYFCWVLYFCYAFAAFFPSGPVWGIHFLGYLPIAARLLLLTAGGVLLIPSIQRSLYQSLVNASAPKDEKHKLGFVLPAVVAVICFLLFLSFTIKTDIYGDTINMLKWYGDNATFDTHWLTDILSPHLVDNKEALTVSVHRIVAYLFSLSIESSYRVMSAVWGSLFVFVWLLFVQKISKGPLRILLVLVGLSAGAMQVFFGHVENYPFGIFTSVLFFVALYFYLEGKTRTVVLLLLYLLAFKAHIVAILFLPALALALLYRYRSRITFAQSLLSWRVLRVVIILPTTLIGLALYFFVFQSWKEPYALSIGRQFQQTFLPIIQLPAPLDHYALWSPYHFIDFINVLLLIGAPIIAILVSLLLYNRKDLDWNQPRLIVFSIAALFPFLFFFAMNPTLSPVRDWDVFTLLFPPLLFLTTILLLQAEVRPYLSSLFPLAIIFGVILTGVLVAVNTSPAQLQGRLQDAGAYTYASYYANAEYIEARALALNDTSTTAPNHLTRIVEELSKAKLHHNDEELASMMARLALLYRTNDLESAIKWANEAKRISPNIIQHDFELADYYIMANKPKLALDVLKIIPPDSGKIDVLTRKAVASAYVYGVDSGLKILAQAKALAPKNDYVDTLISDMKKQKK